MSLIFHIVRKDIVRLQAWVAVWLFVLALPVVLAVLNEKFVFELNKVGIGGLQHVLQILIAVVIVVLLVQGDSVLGTRAFWRTRPIGPGRLLAAKLLAALAIVWGGWMLVGLPWWLWCGWGVGEITRAGLDALVLALVLITPGFVLGALTDSIARAIIWSPISFVFFIWFLPAVAGSMGQFEAHRFFVRTIVAACVTSLLVWAALTGFYRGTWGRKAFWFWGVGAVALWLLAAQVPLEQIPIMQRREYRPELGRGIEVKFEGASTDLTRNRKVESVHVRTKFSVTGADQQPYAFDGMGATQRWTWGTFDFEQDVYLNRMGARGNPTGFSSYRTDPETIEYYRQKREATGRSIARVPIPTLPSIPGAHLQSYLLLFEQQSIAHRMATEPSSLKTTLWLSLLRDSVSTAVPLAEGTSVRVGTGGDHRMELRTAGETLNGWRVAVCDFVPLSWTREFRDVLRRADSSFLYRDRGDYMIFNRATKESVVASPWQRPKVTYVHGVGVSVTQYDAFVPRIARQGVLQVRPDWQSGLTLAYVKWETAAIFKREVNVKDFQATASQPLRVVRDADQKK